MLFTIKDVAIAGMAAGVPKRIARIKDKKDISSHYGVEDFIKSTGIEEVRFSDSLTTADLGIEATRQLLNDLSWEPESIDALFLVTQSPDYMIPATSCIMQDKLGLSKECFALDISLGCSGWIYGLSNLGALISAGQFKRALLVVGDAAPRVKTSDPIDPLFGYATTVTALERHDGETMYFHVGTDGSGWDKLYIPDGGSKSPFSLKSFQTHDFHGEQLSSLVMHMEGMDIFSFAISTAPKSVKKLKKEYGIEDDQIDYYIFHQANKLIVDTIDKKLNVPEEKRTQSMRHFGNTSGASTPLTIVTTMLQPGGGQIRRSPHVLRFRCWPVMGFRLSNAA